MKIKIEIDTESGVPVYKQLVQIINRLIDEQDIKEGDMLPSLNELSQELGLAKETINKAYSILRETGKINSSHGKGFFVTNDNNRKISILLLIDRITAYKQVMLNEFTEAVKEIADITIRLHNQDLDLFESFVLETADLFDYYLVIPHFPLGTDVRIIKSLKKIPNRKLIVLDRKIENLKGHFGYIYQDIERDVYKGLSDGIDRLKEFKKLNMISMPDSLYAPIIERGVIKLCNQHAIAYSIHNCIDSSLIRSGEVYLIINSQLDIELIELVRSANEKGYQIGKDIGIISYNESPINEIILNGLSVLSTDYRQMGRLAAEMIIGNRLKKEKCSFGLIRRGTF